GGAEGARRPRAGPRRHRAALPARRPARPRRPGGADRGPRLPRRVDRLPGRPGDRHRARGLRGGQPEGGAGRRSARGPPHPPALPRRRRVAALRRHARDRAGTGAQPGGRRPAGVQPAARHGTLRALLHDRPDHAVRLPGRHDDRPRRPRARGRAAARGARRGHDLPPHHPDRTVKPPDLPVTFEDVLAAADRLEGAIERTPTAHSRVLSDVLGCHVVVKFENLQFVSSFKERGALNVLAQLSEDERAAGVVAMSAGNHAQAVAYHATRLGIDATIVMPTATPFVKVQRTRELGARVVLRGDDLAEAEAEAKRLVAEEGRTYVHPFDDPAVIAGQGTCALELL